MKAGVVGGPMGGEIALVFAPGRHGVRSRDRSGAAPAQGERFRPPAFLEQRVAAGSGSRKKRAGRIEARRNGQEGVAG